MDHPLVAGRSDGVQTVENVHRKGVTDPMYFPSFRVRKGVITLHRKEQRITKCDTLIRATLPVRSERMANDFSKISPWHLFSCREV
jgi:hypothetical protein